VLVKSWEKISLEEAVLSGLILTKDGITFPSASVFLGYRVLEFSKDISFVALHICKQVYLLGETSVIETSLRDHRKRRILPIKKAQLITCSKNNIFVLGESWIRAYNIDRFQLRWETNLTLGKPDQAFTWRNKLYVYTKQKNILIYDQRDGRFIGKAGPFLFESITATNKGIWILKGERIYLGRRGYLLKGDFPEGKRIILGAGNDLYFTVKGPKGLVLFELLEQKHLYEVGHQLLSCAQCPCGCSPAQESLIGQALWEFSPEKVRDKILYFEALVPETTAVRLIIREKKGGNIVKQGCIDSFTFCFPEQPPPETTWEVVLCLEAKKEEGPAPVVKLLALIPSAQDWLKYLPPVFSEEPQSRRFLKNFLGVFKVIYTTFGAQIEEWPYRLASSCKEPEITRYLARWLDIDPDLALLKLEKRLAHWPKLYPIRGTRQALEGVLKEFCLPRKASSWVLVEAFEWLEPGQNRSEQQDCLEEVAGDSWRERAHGWVELFGADFKSYVLLLDPQFSRRSYEELKKLVLDWTPLGVKAQIIRLSHAMILGTPLILGWNTVISCPPPVLGEGYLGQTVLSDLEQGGRLGERAWLGLDTFLS